jgi:glycerol kinase
MKNDSGHSPEIIRADGGLVENHFVCQFLADMLNVKVEIPESAETTAQGAAYLAGLTAGIYKDFEDIGAKWRADRCYSPAMDEMKRERLYAGWKEALQRIL